MSVTVRQFRSSSGDNYAYVLYGSSGDEALLVDPVAPEAVRAFLRERSLTPTRLINTHAHPDHTAANDTFRREQNVRVLCHPAARDALQGVERGLEDGETLTVGGGTVRVIHTPGHTPDSLGLVTDSGFLSGDTVFLAGCGNPKFGGDTDRLFETFRDRIRPLDDDLRLYPGHDYAVKNLRFARECEPDNDAARRKLEEVRGAASAGEEPTSTLGEEKTYNPFLRFDVPGLARSLSDVEEGAEPRAVFCALRSLRNRW